MVAILMLEARTELSRHEEKQECVYGPVAADTPVFTLLAEMLLHQTSY